MTLKIYKTIVHSHHTTRYAFVCASSKKRVAEILNTPLSQLQHYGCNALNSNTHEYRKYGPLKDGEVAYEDIQTLQSSNGISVRDLHRIAALGYMDAALQSLNQCDMPNRDISNRLVQLLGLLKDLKDDTKEALEQTYNGR